MVFFGNPFRIKNVIKTSFFQLLRCSTFARRVGYAVVVVLAFANKVVQVLSPINDP